MKNANLFLKIFMLPAFIIASTVFTYAQVDNEQKIIELINKRFEDLGHRLDMIDKSIDDLAWFNRIGDIAFIDKVYITGPPPANIKDPLVMGAEIGRASCRERV